jgi:lysophospholipase L1-like esterase
MTIGLLADEEEGGSCREKINQAIQQLNSLPTSFPSEPLPYTGFVATRCAFMHGFDPTPKQSMMRSAHYARDDITSLKLLLPNLRIGGGLNETGTGATATVTASIEYPLGTRTVVLFGGSSSGTIADINVLLSDAVTVTIPNGALFWVKVWFSSTGGILYSGTTATNSPINTTLGEAFDYGVTTPDLTNSATNPTGTILGGVYPLGIIGTTTKPSVLVLGDSKSAGTLDTGDGSGDYGQECRSFGGLLAYCNAGVSGDQVQSLVGSHTQRVALGAYCSHVIISYGGNDITVGRTAAQVAADISTVAGYFSGKQIYVNTQAPVSSSLDGWTTIDGQTKDGNNAVRLSLNTKIRNVLPGATGYLEVADQFESDRDSGYWKAPYYTTDGIHPTQYAYRAVALSNAVGPQAMGIDGAAASVQTPMREYVRDVCQANRTYYVRTNGSDSNTGRFNTAAGAFLTIGKAMTAITKIDFNGFVVTVQIADGTYTETVTVPACVGTLNHNSLLITGNPATPANVVVTQAVSFGSCFFLNDKAGCFFNGLKLAGTNNGYGIRCNNAHAEFANIDFSTCAQAHVYCSKGIVISFDNYTISGNAFYHLQSIYGGTIITQFQTVTASGGSRAFGGSFVRAEYNGQIAGASTTYSGTYTGSRYSAVTNGSINVFGGTTTYFPGDAVGTTATGGQYA